MEVAKHNGFTDFFLHVFQQWAGMREVRHLLVRQPDMSELRVFLLGGRTPCNQMKDGSAHGMEEESMRSGAS